MRNKLRQNAQRSVLIARSLAAKMNVSWKLCIHEDNMDIWLEEKDLLEEHRSIEGPIDEAPDVKIKKKPSTNQNMDQDILELLASGPKTRTFILKSLGSIYNKGSISTRAHWLKLNGYISTPNRGLYQRTNKIYH